jgi:hypothetical protein
MDPRHESMNQRRDSKVGVTSVNCLRIVQQTTITHHDMAGQRGPVPVYGQASGRDLTQEVLDLLSTKQTVATETDLADVAQAEIKAALDRLASRNMITYETNDQEQVVLTKEGEVIANEGSHEFKVWDAVKRRGQMPLKELQVMLKRQSDDYLRMSLMKSQTECSWSRFSQGWTGQCIQAQVDQKGRRCPRLAGRLSQRHDTRNPHCHPRHQISVRQQTPRRPQEAQVGHRHKSHQLRCYQG